MVISRFNDVLNRRVENMEKKKSLIRRIWGYEFPWTKSLEKKLDRQNALMIAALKGDEEEFWKAWRK
jgi:hypothetical protein